MAGSSGIFLRWNNHREALASLLCSQLEKEDFVDVTIAAEGKFINVHRLVLCSSSPYFEELLGQHHKPAIIILQNVKFCDVQLIIEYIYKGEISLSGDQLHSFLEAAKSLKIKGLTQKENNLNQVQVPTVAMEMPPTPELTPDSIRPVQEAAESADQSEITTMSETGENLNHQEQVEHDVVMIEEEIVPNKSGMGNQSQDSNLESPEDKAGLSSSDSSSDDEEREPHQQPNKELVPRFGCTLCDFKGRKKWSVKLHLSRRHKNVLLDDFSTHIRKIQPSFPLENSEPDVVIVNQPPRPDPVIVNLDESMIEEEQVPNDVAENNQDIMERNDRENLDGDSSSSSGDEEGDPKEGSSFAGAKPNKSSSQRQDKEQSANGNKVNPSLRKTRFACDRCGRGFRRRAHLMAHNLSVNCRLVSWIRCNLCGKYVKNRRCIKRHLSRMHGMSVESSKVGDYIV